MTKRKKRYPPAPPMQHMDKFRKYLTPKPVKKHSIGTHCGFRLINQLPLYRLDNNQNVEL